MQFTYVLQKVLTIDTIENTDDLDLFVFNFVGNYGDKMSAQFDAYTKLMEFAEKDLEIINELHPEWHYCLDDYAVKTEETTESILSLVLVRRHGEDPFELHRFIVEQTEIVTYGKVA